MAPGVNGWGLGERMGGVGEEELVPKWKVG